MSTTIIFSTAVVLITGVSTTTTSEELTTTYDPLKESFMRDICLFLDNDEF